MAEGGMGKGGGNSGQGGSAGSPGNSGSASKGGAAAAAPSGFAQPVSHAGIQEPVSGSPKGAESAAHAAHAGMEATTHGRGSQVGAPVGLPKLNK